MNASSAVTLLGGLGLFLDRAHDDDTALGQLCLEPGIGRFDDHRWAVSHWCGRGIRRAVRELGRCQHGRASLLTP
jgi:hypothetical protein